MGVSGQCKVSLSGDTVKAPRSCLSVPRPVPQRSFQSIPEVGTRRTSHKELGEHWGPSDRGMFVSAPAALSLLN